MTKRHIVSTLKWLFSGAMLLYALHEIDMDEVMHMLTHQNPLIPLAVIFLMIFQMWISTFRWQRILYVLCGKLRKEPYRLLFRLNFISIFFNSCLPGTIGGDVVRAMMLKSEHTPITLCAHSVIIDRAMAMFAIYIMATISLPWLGNFLPSLPIYPFMGLSIAALIAGFILLAYAPALLARIPTSAVIRIITSLIDSAKRVLTAPRDLPILLMQAMLAHGCFCMGVYLLGQSMELNFTFIDTLILIPPVLLLIMLPISVGGWGVREVTMVAALTLVGVPKEAALTISVQMGVLVMIASLPGAWLYIKRPRPAENASQQS